MPVESHDSNSKLRWILHVLDQLNRRDLLSASPALPCLRHLVLRFTSRGLTDVLDALEMLQDSLVRLDWLQSCKVELHHVCDPEDLELVISRIETRLVGLRKIGWLDVTNMEDNVES